MYETLSQLNKTTGITGSMVVGNDGIVIAADLDQHSDDDTLGALASSIAATVRRSLTELGSEDFSQITVEADRQKIFLTDAGVGTLVVTTEPRVNIGLVRLEIRNAVAALQKS
ncbi:MAG: roadblock/LC7 domain-containing protein [candidate division Zixibacteria bacterium]|nr:roadblock/LC7 domain-containing protein [candidate division Zixibacteria bacterium]